MLRHPMWCVCAFLPFAAWVAAAEPARVHEARQGPISTQSDASPLGPGPVSIRPTTTTTTMSPTPSSSSERSFSSSSTFSLQSSPSDSSASSPLGTETSSATPQPSSSPGRLSFVARNMTTCSSALISWSYSGPEAGMYLSVLSSGLGGSATSSSVGTRQSSGNPTVQQVLVNTNASALSWTWSPVNVTQGWYQLQGLVFSAPVVNSTSVPFFIANGTNVSCLAGASPQVSSTALPTASASPSSGALASKTDVGAIVGGVIGAVVLVAVAVIVGICLRLRRRKGPPVGGGRIRKQKWGSLKSNSSSIQPGGAGAQPTGDRFHDRTESMAGVLEDAGGQTSAASTPVGSDEDVVVTSAEKPVSPASPPGMSPFDVLNTPVHYDRRTSACYPAQVPLPVASDDARSRSASLRASNQSMEQQTQRIRSSMEISARRRSERLSMPSLPPPSLSRHPYSHVHATSKEEYALSPVTATPVSRSVSAGAVSMTARRTSRKPVPQYDPSALLEDPNTDSVSTFTGGAESSQSHGTGMGTGAFGTQTDLVHKTSFGDGRPVHYLIPDMPPPQRD